MLRIGESVSFDHRLAPFDVQGSQAQAAMLAHVGIISGEERDAICAGLDAILGRIEAGEFDWDPALEDVHMNIEQALTAEVPAAANCTPRVAGTIKSRPICASGLSLPVVGCLSRSTQSSEGSWISPSARSRSSFLDIRIFSGRSPFRWRIIFWRMLRCLTATERRSWRCARRRMCARSARGDRRDDTPDRPRVRGS